MCVATFWFGWSFLTLWHAELPLLAWGVLTRYTLGGLLLLYLSPLVTQYWKASISALLIAGVGAAALALLQFIGQDDLGLRFFSEPLLSPDKDGVAKTTLGGQTLLRGYAFFPHPNVLAFFVFSALAGLFWREITALPSSKPKREEAWDNVSRETYQYLGLAIIILCLGGISLVDHYLLTSAQAFYAFLILIVLLISRPVSPVSPLPPARFWGIVTALTGGVLVSWSHAVWPFFAALALLTLHARGVFHVKHSDTRTRPSAETNRATSRPRIKILLIAGGILALGVVFGAIPWGGPAFDKRVLYLERSFEIIQNTPLWGTGLHQYVNALPSGLPAWQYEPVHSIWLLMTAETGLVGGVLFALCSLTGLIVIVRRV